MQHENMGGGFGYWKESNVANTARRLPIGGVALVGTPGSNCNRCRSDGSVAVAQFCEADRPRVDLAQNRA